MTDSQAASAISDISQALQTMRETGLEQRLVPNDALASQVEAALSALSTGASTSDADFFLRSVLAHPPAALSAAAALLRDTTPPLRSRRTRTQRQRPSPRWQDTRCRNARSRLL
jgi:hypothetical protein